MTCEEGARSCRSLLGWLQANPRSRKASEWWDRLQAIPEMLWLASAAGETPARVRVARQAAESEWYVSTRAKIVREFVPWVVLVELLFKGEGR